MFKSMFRLNLFSLTDNFKLLRKISGEGGTIRNRYEYDKNLSLEDCFRISTLEIGSLGGGFYKRDREVKFGWFCYPGYSGCALKPQSNDPAGEEAVKVALGSLIYRDGRKSNRSDESFIKLKDRLVKMKIIADPESCEPTNLGFMGRVSEPVRNHLKSVLLLRTACMNGD